ILPRLKHWKAMQKLDAIICHESSSFETAESVFAAERVDHAIAGVCAKQIHAFQLIAERQICHAGICDTALPGHLKSPELGQMSQTLKTLIGDPAARIFT